MKKALLIVLSGIAILLLAFYLGMSIYFGSHYFPNTKIGTLQASGKSADYMISKNQSVAEDYLLTITDRKGNRFSIRGMDISYEYVPSGEEERLLDEQKNFAWPLEITKEHSYELAKSVTYNTDSLEEVLKQQEFFTEEYIEKPTDAHILLEDGNYELVKETEGASPIYAQVFSEVTTALSNQDETLTLSDQCYETPEILSTDPSITDVANQIESYSKAEIHYEIDGVNENLDSSTILKMLSIKEDGAVVLDEGKIQSFVQHLASTYNTYGDVRKFKTSKGDKIKIGGGDYGWVINKSKEYEQILTDLGNGEPVSREPVYEQRAIKSGLDDIGDTYIEIDYGSQHLWYYKEGKLLSETDIVSGCLRTQNGSVDGIYKIVYKEKDATLVGEGYSSPVKYFMPFAYNIGIHDASWRSSFGEEIYRNSGSHGCINVPAEKAKELFEIVEKGTPVVAYYREPVVLTNTAAQISNAYSYKKPEE